MMLLERHHAEEPDVLSDSEDTKDTREQSLSDSGSSVTSIGAFLL